MSHRRTISVLIAVLISLGGASVSAGERPNILIIVSEDNGPELGCYGEPFVRTPVLDRLAAEGVRFQNACVPQAGCSQSRAALLTGLYPHQNGQIGLATWKFRMYREDTPNLVRCLKQAGYRTGMIGKLHINPAAAFPFDMHEIPSANFSRRKLGDYAKHAEGFFKAGKEPFFLSVNYPDAHRPFIRQVRGLPATPLSRDDVKPLAYFGLDTQQLRSDTADYYNCMNRLDSLIGDVLEALDRSGKADNTLVVYLGDHGADLLRGKRTSYEGGVRVPLIVRWPGEVQPKQTRDELVSTLDLMPTLLKVADAEPVEELPGRSLLPLLRGEAAPWREHLFTEFHLHSAHNFYPQRTVRNARYKLIQNLLPGEENPGYEYTIRRFFADLPKAIEAAPEHIRLAYQRMKTPPEYELYDLKEDPHEFRNLADDPEHAATFSELKTVLADWRSRSRDPLLERANLSRLKAEVDACFVDGAARKERLTLTYPEYFFRRSRALPHPANNPTSPVMLAGDWVPDDPGKIEFARLRRVPSQHAVISDVRDRGGNRVHQHAYLAHHDGRYWAMWSDGPGKRVRGLTPEQHRNVVPGHDQPGTRVSFATSRNGVHWSQPADLSGPPRIKDFGWIARGLWVRNGELLALASHFHAPGYAGKGLSLEAFRWNKDDDKWEAHGTVLDDTLNNFPPKRLPSGQYMMTRRDHQRQVSVIIGGEKAFDAWTVYPLASYDGKGRPEEPYWYILPDGSNIAGLIRDNGRSGRLLRTFSADNGRTWSPITRTNFPDATSKFFVLRTSRGYYVMVSNANPRRRDPLTLAVSRDGLVFDHLFYLVGGRHVDYPHIIEHDKHLLIAFSGAKQTMEVLKVSLADLDKLIAAE